ncbi:MAG: hypothetical protein ACOC4J_00410 [Bacteroidota bacterium]
MEKINYTELAENNPQGTANIADDRVLPPVFDWKAFKKYVNTYDPKKHGVNDQKTIMHDMLYGIGLSIDREKYQYSNGYRKFEQFLKELF